MKNTNTFDDFDTHLHSDELPCFTCGGLDHLPDCPEVPTPRDESLMGGQYHGPSNSAGLTSREYWESRYEYEDEQERLRNDW